VSRPPNPKDPQGPEDDGRSNLAEGYRNAAPYLNAVYSLVAAVGVFSALGYWADQKMGNRIPWFLLLGLLVGMVGGFTGFFRTVLRATRNEK
jgi:F0F1-type ATP synthase assembly protein I